MKKITLRSLISAVSIGTAAHSMELCWEIIPQDVQLNIIKNQGHDGKTILDNRDVIRLLQVSKQFNVLAKNADLWGLLSQQDGFSSHPNTAFKCHYNYLKGVQLRVRWVIAFQNPPNFQDLQDAEKREKAKIEFLKTPSPLLDEILVCFNKAAPFMHLGAIGELMIFSALLTENKKCIYVPEEMDFDVCSLLLEDQFLSKSDVEFLNILPEYDFFAFRNSQKIRARFFQLLKKKDLYFGDIVVHSPENNEINDVLYHNFFLFLFQSGNLNPFLFDILEHFLFADLFTPIVPFTVPFLPDRMDENYPPNYNDYICLLNHEIRMKNPALYFYKNEIGRDNPFMMVPDDYMSFRRGKPNEADLDGEKLLAYFGLAKLTWGNHIDIPSIHALTTENMFKDLPLQLCQEVFNFNRFPDYQKHLLQTSQPKLLELAKTISNTKNLIAVYSLLSRTYTAEGDYENALQYAQQAYDLGLLNFLEDKESGFFRRPLLYVMGTDLDYYDTHDFFGKPIFYAFLKAKQFDKAQEILNRLPDIVRKCHLERSLAEAYSAVL